MSGQPQTALLGIGGYRPGRVVTNAELAGRGHVTDAWIRSRVGIHERRRAGEEETVVVMAAEAAGKALSTAGLAPSQIDLVLLATCSMPTPMPNGAAEVAHLLGVRAAALDVNSACAGFCYALAVADATVRAGTAQAVVVIGAERMSDWTDPADRATSVIFADGAGAAIVGPAPRRGIWPVVWGSDGSRSHLIRIPAGTGTIEMAGPAVFRWAVTELEGVAREACARAGVTPNELAGFVPHQANARIVDTVAARLGIPAQRVARDIVRTGNTSAASVPLALLDMVERDLLRRGDPVLLLGFGAGLTFAAQVVSCP